MQFSHKFQIFKNKGFVLNRYDPCVVNEIINEKKATSVWHVDGSNVSHKQSNLVNDLLGWVKKKIYNDFKTWSVYCYFLYKDYAYKSFLNLWFFVIESKNAKHIMNQLLQLFLKTMKILFNHLSLNHYSIYMDVL